MSQTTSMLRFLQEEETLDQIIDELLYDSNSYDFESTIDNSLYNNNGTATDYYDDYHDRSGFGNYRLRQQMALAILPKFTSFLSLIGSLCIISEVVMDQRKKAFSSVNRILLSMSIADIFFSTGWFLGVWPSPKDSSYNQWGAAGNTQTCTFQGFIMQFGWTAGPLFNLTLSLYYLLIIRYNWRQDNLKSLDPWVHGTIWSLALGLAILPIPMNLYNNAWEVCWIESLPRQCGGPDGQDCIRGTDKAWIYALTLSSIFPSYLCMFLSVVFMGWIYLSVRHMETRNMIYAGGKASNAIQTRARSTRVRSQAILFIGAFYFAFLPDAVSSMMYYTTGRRYFWLDIFAYGLCMPIQGLFNCLVFLRQREVMQSWLGKLVQRIVCRGLCQHIPALVPKSLFISPLELPSTLVTYTGESLSMVAHSIVGLGDSIVGLGEEASTAFAGILRRNSETFDGASSILSGLFKNSSAGSGSDDGSISSSCLDANGATTRSGRKLSEDDSHSDIEYSENDVEIDDIEALYHQVPPNVGPDSEVLGDDKSSISSNSNPIVIENDTPMPSDSEPTRSLEGREIEDSKGVIEGTTNVPSSAPRPPLPPSPPPAPQTLTPKKSRAGDCENMTLATVSDVESPTFPTPQGTPSFKRMTFTGFVEVSPIGVVPETEEPVNAAADATNAISPRQTPVKPRRLSVDNVTLDTLSDSESPIDGNDGHEETVVGSLHRYRR